MTVLETTPPEVGIAIEDLQTRVATLEAQMQDVLAKVPAGADVLLTTLETTYGIRMPEKPDTPPKEGQ